LADRAAADLIALVFSRMPIAVRRRLIFLFAANLLLLLAIALLMREGASFSQVLRRLGPDIAPIALAGFAMTGIMFAAAIDLSIASALALSGTVFGALVFHGVPPIPAFAGCFATALAIMSFNGLLVARLKIPAIIVTLAGLPFYRGLALILADITIPNFSGNISIPSEAYQLPGKVFAVWILAAALASALLFETFGKHPRLWLALGNSPDAANLIGLEPRRVLSSAYLIGGIFFGLAVLVFATRVQALEPARMALGFELQVIAAVILGGTSIFGGEGSYLGTFLGAVFLYLVGQVLIYANASAYLQDAITGAVILAIIGIDCALHRKRKLMEELS
jgi:ribose/xylose/arabinose/galactoside ABC-type transport system permease subunit